MEKFKSVGKYILNFLLILVIGCFIMYLTVGKEIGSVFEAVKTAKIQILGIMAAIMLVYYFIDAFILYLICKARGYKLHLRQTFVTNMTGVLFSDLTPSATGGQFAQVYVFHNQGIHAGQASGILAIVFITYQIVIITYATIAMLVNATAIFQNSQSIVIGTVGFAVNVIITGGIFLATRSAKVHDFLIVKVIGFLAKIKIVKNYEKTAGEISESFSEFRDESAELFAKRKLFVQVCLCHAVKLTFFYTLPFFAAMSLGVPVTVSDLPKFISLAAAISLFNTFMPLPGASGGSEASFVMLFGFLGKTIASTAMLIWRVFSFYFGLILSLGVVAASRETKGGIVKAASGENIEDSEVNPQEGSEE
ncbi:MAG: flippase-like domain-containing protein [Clostridiales bacterium]|nr:flippase-like domain-containing protein [Clostridiales bacterium]MBR6488385.1 flippase-like domain-containing protein [Clostridiales bacterium]